MISQLEERIFNIQTHEQFESVALDVFQFQYENTAIYRKYVQQLGRPIPTKLSEIPFLPISFFKTHQVIAKDRNHQRIFKSSGTGGNRSTHYVSDLSLYERSFNITYDQHIGHPEEQVILALLPNYLEQGESSLVYMVDHLIQRTGSDLSGFFLQNHQDLITRYNQAISIGRKVVIIGVSYALLDLAALNPNLSEAIIIETGGMKGRRKEMTKEELHDALIKGFGCDHIASEYGMTELLSQGYSTKENAFQTGSMCKFLIREVNDPFNYIENGKTGGVNVIDLANLYSCSFIETQDLGKQTNEGLQIMGRFDHSDIRGCNLLVE